jgi:hypothetical protein
MCLGKIPIVIDTDLVMPYDFVIRWREYGVDRAFGGREDRRKGGGGLTAPERWRVPGPSARMPPAVGAIPCALVSLATSISTLRPICKLERDSRSDGPRRFLARQPRDWKPGYSWLEAGEAELEVTFRAKAIDHRRRYLASMSAWLYKVQPVTRTETQLADPRGTPPRAGLRSDPPRRRVLGK